MNITEEKLNIIRDMSHGVLLACKQNMVTASLDLQLCPPSQPDTPCSLTIDGISWTLKGELRSLDRRRAPNNLSDLVMIGCQQFHVVLTAVLYLGSYQLIVPLGMRSIMGVDLIREDAVIFHIS